MAWLKHWFVTVTNTEHISGLRRKNILYENKIRWTYISCREPGGYKEMSSILGSPIAPSYMSSNAGGGRGVLGSQPMSTTVQRNPDKLTLEISIFNL